MRHDALTLRRAAILALMACPSCTTSVTPPDTLPVANNFKVTIELDQEPGGCKIQNKTNIARLKVQDDDVPVWTIKNKCDQDQVVEIYGFTFKRVLPAGDDDASCDPPTGTTAEPCPMEGDASCQAKQRVKKKPAGGEGKAKVARGVNTFAENRACYKYSIRLGSGDFVDPEYVIWR